MLVQPSDRVLIMTSTIRPRADAAYVGYLDPKARLNDYRSALAFYAPMVGNVFSKLVYIDNSGESLEPFQSFASNPNITLYSYYGLDYPPEYGRGYGEMKIIERAYELDELNLSESRYVWKVTGRYKVMNLASIVGCDRSSRNPEIICHSRSIPRHWTELYCLGWNPSGFRKFVSRLSHQFRHDVTDLWPEVLMNALVQDKRRYSDLRVRCRFPRTPWVEGVRGLNGLPFHTRSQRVKHIVREWSRLVLPWLWV